MENSFLSEFKERDYFNQCTNSVELEQVMNNKKIRAYIGFDCTASSLHVGSLLQIMCLRLLQKHGHQPIVLLGGGTTRIGDPSGKEETRKILSEKEIEKNIKNIEKIFKIFLKTNNPKTKPIFTNNYKWLGKLNYIKFLREIGKHFTINNNLPGRDNKFAILPNMMSELSRTIKRYYLMKKEQREKFSKQEKEIRKVYTGRWSH